MSLSLVLSCVYCLALATSYQPSFTILWRAVTSTAEPTQGWMLLSCWQCTLESSSDMPRSLDWPRVKSMHSVELIIIRVYGMPRVAWKKSFNNASPQAWAWRGFLSLAVLIWTSIQYCSHWDAPSAVRGGGVCGRVSFILYPVLVHIACLPSRSQERCQ